MMRTVTVAQLMAQLSGYPPDTPILVNAGGVDLKTHEAELVQGGWDPPFVRIVPVETSQGGAGAARRLTTSGAVFLLLIALLCFMVGFFAGSG
jgi:hypothetical protein